jgi:predicted glutamine amidotransferase
MCRLFGLHADKRMVTATFWLLDAPDNLVEQSKRNPDGTGLGVFGADGKPGVYKQPMAAWQDQPFATEAHDLTGTTFIAHVRYSSSAALEVRNTHPFLQDDRIFAVNILLSTATDMWALRYPETHELYLLDRRDVDDRRLRMRSHRICAHSEELTSDASVLFASEPMDDDDWQMLAPGELVHVDANLRIDRRMAFPDPPKHQLHHADLTAQAAASQHASVA